MTAEQQTVYMSSSVQIHPTDSIVVESVTSELVEEPTSTTSSSSKSSTDSSCCICIQRSRDTRLTCGHTFCYMCIYNWHLRQSHCPLCRKQIDTSSFGEEPENIRHLNRSYIISLSANPRRRSTSRNRESNITRSHNRVHPVLNNTEQVVVIPGIDANSREQERGLSRLLSIKFNDKELILIIILSVCMISLIIFLATLVVLCLTSVIKISKTI